MFFLKSLRLPYSEVEEGETKSLYWKALGALSCGDWSAMYRMSYGTISIIKNSISFVLYSTVLTFLSPWMVIFLLVLSLLQYGISISKIRYMERFREKSAELEKKENYLFEGAMGKTEAAKDIRIFGMQRWLNQEKELLLDEVEAHEKKEQRAEQFCWQLTSLLALVRDVTAYAYLITQTARGVITAGDFVLYFGAITGFSGFVMSIMDSLADLRQSANGTNFYRAYMELPEEDCSSGSCQPVDISELVSVEFRDVSFAYEDGGNKIFDHLNLTIHAGEKLAVVGANGAGKTTLVKLLCGLYEPNEGSILINGIDRRKLPKQELYRLFSAVFQEGFLLPVTAGKNISLSEEYDENRTRQALAAAGIGDLLEEKGATLDSFIGKDFDENGLEFSGGQEQRFLFARALYKDAPMLILDEPTAALDPIAESEIYDSYAQYTEGKTALFISHRLASTRFSDRIVLIGDGGILEEGTHEELLHKGGAYAEMFAVQSSYYAKKQMEKELFA